MTLTLRDCLSSQCIICFKYYRDWRGLAHLIGLKSEEIPVLAFDTDPTARILHLWHKQSKSLCTIKQLQTYLEQLDRYDIVHDTAEMIGEFFKFIYSLKRFNIPNFKNKLTRLFYCE